MYAVLVRARNDVVIGDSYRIHTAPWCLEAVYDLQGSQVPHLDCLVAAAEQVVAVGDERPHPVVESGQLALQLVRVHVPNLVDEILFEYLIQIFIENILEIGNTENVAFCNIWLVTQNIFIPYPVHLTLYTDVSA